MAKKVIVIGAGASGLMAAAAAAQNGHRVTVLEKNEKAGKKIYITGKGRCNLTNDCAVEDFFAHVPHNHKFLYSAVYGFDQNMVKEFFENNGCPVRTERGNRVFPRSDHASDVTAALLRRLQALGVTILYRVRVAEILTKTADTPAEEFPAKPVDSSAADTLMKSVGTGTPADALMEKDLSTETPVRKGRKEKKESAPAKRMVCGVKLQDGRRMEADAVILCTGGLSYPSTGSTGDGLAMAGRLGLTVTPTAPSLVPFETREEWCRDLQGLALKNVAVKVFPVEESPQPLLEDAAEPQDPGKKKTGHGQGRKKKSRPVYEGFGELLFTHFGLSGPIILTASCFCDFTKSPQGFKLFMDLKPALSGQQLAERLRREFTLAPNRHLPGAVRPLFPARLADAVTELSGLDTGRRAASFTESEIAALAALIKNIPVTVTGTRGYQEAIITRGGIDVREVDPSSMESRKIRGLFLAGEILDVDAQTGGFNLQIAWSTGHLAGSSI